MYLKYFTHIKIKQWLKNKMHVNKKKHKNMLLSNLQVSITYLI